MNMTKPVIVLTVICIVCSALLGATYTATAPLIAASEKAASDAAMIEVLPGAASFTEIPVELEGVLTVAKDDSGLGYAFKVQDKGFGGAYTIMVGISSDGKVTVQSCLTTVKPRDLVPKPVRRISSSGLLGWNPAVLRVNLGVRFEL